MIGSAPTAAGKDPERKRLFFGAALGEEEMRGADGTNWFFAIEAGHQWPVSRHVFFRLSGGPRYQHMSNGPENAIAFQLNPSIGYILASRLYVAFEPTLGVSSAGNQVIEMGELENSANPYYKLFTFSAAYIHQGVYEIAVTFNFDSAVGEFHSDTNQLSLGFRYHL